MQPPQNDPRYAGFQQPWPQQYAQPQQQTYSQPPQQHYSQPPMQQMQQYQPYPPRTPQLPGALANMNQPSGMPSVLAFPFAFVAVLIALVCDVIFLNVNVPGVGGYAWYLSTALSFAGAGYAGAKFTKATRGIALTAIGVAGALYGLADLVVGFGMEHLTMNDAIFLGAQGVGIAIFTGFGGVYRGLRAKR